MIDLPAIVGEIVERRSRLPREKALLVGVSGIDASGKGYVSGRIVEGLTAAGVRVGLINLDGWLNLPPIRFDPARLPENFYENGFRFEELFDRLVVPLRESRSAHLDMDFVEETATAYRPYTYEFDDVDVIVLEGIFLYNPSYRSHFDLAVWVDTSWETAQERAISRGQEGLPPEETVNAFRTIYFPAQEIHFARDAPRESADLIFPNDPHLAERGPAGG